MHENRRTAGFSLIELAIVLLIVAILMAVAIPSYRKYVVRSNRVDAQRTLVDIAAREEQVFYGKNAYTSQLTDINATSTMAGPNYTIDIASASSTAFVARATAAGQQATSDKQCQTLTLSNTGVQGSTGTTANDTACWGR